MTPRAYVKYFADIGYYCMTKRQLPGIALHISYRDRGDVLASDCKRGLWYFVDGHGDRRYYYGPFSSKQEAGRAFDARATSSGDKQEGLR